MPSPRPNVTESQAQAIIKIAAGCLGCFQSIDAIIEGWSDAIVRDISSYGRWGETVYQAILRSLQREGFDTSDHIDYAIDSASEICEAIFDQFGEDADLQPIVDQVLEAIDRKARQLIKAI